MADVATCALQSLEGFLKFPRLRRTAQAHQQMHPIFLLKVFCWCRKTSFRMLTAYPCWPCKKINVLSNVSVGTYLKRQKRVWSGQPAQREFHGWGSLEVEPAESRTPGVKLHFESSWAFMAWSPAFFLLPGSTGILNWSPTSTGWCRKPNRKSIF